MIALQFSSKVYNKKMHKHFRRLIPDYQTIRISNERLVSKRLRCRARGKPPPRRDNEADVSSVSPSSSEQIEGRWVVFVCRGGGGAMPCVEKW